MLFPRSFILDLIILSFKTMADHQDQCLDRQGFINYLTSIFNEECVEKENTLVDNYAELLSITIKYCLKNKLLTS